ncbi:MAG: M23 family metallopeptidase [Candidatus Micrarchaeia archaeon]
MNFTAAFELAQFYLSLLLPLLLILWQIFGKNKSKFDWIVRFIFSASFFIWIYFLLPWAILNYYLRYIFPILFLIASIYSFQKLRITKSKTIPLFKKAGIKDYLYYGCLLVMAVLFLLTAITCFRAQFYPIEAVQLQFPFKGGQYFFSQAGSNTALNTHTSKSQKYAYDIIKIDSFGFRGKGLLSDNLYDYYIFDEMVYAPCNGVVSKINNLSEDMPIMQRNEREPEGNYVILDCSGVSVHICHFKKGSLLVSEGELITTGQPLGRIGNSGRTTEPHLHIHAENMFGEAIPIAFNGKTFVRNDIFNAEEK